MYTEYNIGHFARSFTLSNKIDQQQISTQLGDGVLTLTLKGEGGHAAANRDQLIEDRKRGRNSTARSVFSILRERQVVSTKVSPHRAALDRR